MSDTSTTGDQALLFSVRDQREPGWFFIDNEIVDKYGVRLGAYGLATYAVLSRRCNPTTQQVSNLSQRDIAAILGVSHDRIRKSFSDLAELSLIQVEVPRRPSPGNISTITLLKVQKTGRVASSPRPELDVRRPSNKEVKTKTVNKTLPNPPFQGGNYLHSRITRRELRKLVQEISYIRANSPCPLHESSYQGECLYFKCWKCSKEGLEARKLVLPIDDETLQVACAQAEVLLPVDRARSALHEIYGFEPEREPQMSRALAAAGD